MDIYLTIMVTILVITQVVRITQNTIQLHRQNILFKEQLSQLKDVTQEDFDKQKKAYSLAVEYFESKLNCEDAHATDVVEARHGKWESGNPTCPVCGEDKFKGLDADIWSDWKPKHCPNCGALMDIKEESNLGSAL